ncbi:hypothetical protein [Sorangium sp. So ce1151]|uniref:hypothetical protein n=1 Tax=Sorangium sp. So ce1151 TaxID=3133332 RepID=UPI003F60F51E
MQEGALSLTGKTYLDIGFDDGAAPSMGVVRLELTLQAASGPVRARVKVNVTANNLRERDFSAAVKKAQEPGAGIDRYDRCYPSGSRIYPAKVKHLIGYWYYTNKYVLDFQSMSVVVPRDQMVCFNAYDDYILVDRGIPLAVEDIGDLIDELGEAADRNGGGVPGLLDALNERFNPLAGLVRNTVEAAEDKDARKLGNRMFKLGIEVLGMAAMLRGGGKRSGAPGRTKPGNLSLAETAQG